MEGLQFHSKASKVFRFVKRILLIDSEPFFDQLLDGMIKEMGHSYAGRFIELPKIDTVLKNESIDIVLINIESQGEFNGIQLAKYIKIEYDIPFYFACGKDCADLKEWATEINPDGFLQCSSNRSYLQDQLERIFEQ